MTDSVGITRDECLYSLSKLGYTQEKVYADRIMLSRLGFLVLEISQSVHNENVSQGMRQQEEHAAEYLEVISVTFV